MEYIPYWVLVIIAIGLFIKLMSKLFAAMHQDYKKRGRPISQKQTIYRGLELIFIAIGIFLVPILVQLTLANFFYSK